MTVWLFYDSPLLNYTNELTSEQGKFNTTIVLNAFSQLDNSKSTHQVKIPIVSLQSQQSFTLNTDSSLFETYIPSSSCYKSFNFSDIAQRGSVMYIDNGPLNDLAPDSIFAVHNYIDEFHNSHSNSRYYPESFCSPMSEDALWQDHTQSIAFGVNYSYALINSVNSLSIYPNNGSCNYYARLPFISETVVRTDKCTKLVLSPAEAKVVMLCPDPLTYIGVLTLPGKMTALPQNISAQQHFQSLSTPNVLDIRFLTEELIAVLSTDFEPLKDDSSVPKIPDPRKVDSQIDIYSISADLQLTNVLTINGTLLGVDSIHTLSFDLMCENDQARVFIPDAIQGLLLIELNLTSNVSVIKTSVIPLNTSKLGVVAVWSGLAIISSSNLQLVNLFVTSANELKLLDQYIIRQWYNWTSIERYKGIL